MSKRGNRGAAAFAQMLDGHTRKRARASFPATDLATIRAGLKLELDSFPIGFPEGDYIVGERFSGAVTGERAGGGGDAQFAAHDHDQAAELAPGDRVVCLILNHDSNSPTPVVVERI